ncbi:Uncharacterized protein dnm_082800 [Desulfonema magnum]|uniref:Uncharacterized protein n=1 Tax=Desulfonema magnum TaxID=45655 RepID=A0A975GSM3_9BACT|nr:Uncharacterized protein dnm_082800 [Desulfonema magnum]
MRCFKAVNSGVQKFYFCICIKFRSAKILFLQVRKFYFRTPDKNILYNF